MKQAIGIVPTVHDTFEVYGPLDEGNLVEGKLYYDKDGVLYYYSTKVNRPNPSTGWFPIWDGTRAYKSLFAKLRRYPKDVVENDIESLSKTITKDKAQEITDKSKAVEDTKILDPHIQDGDGMFTQCIKGIIDKYHITMTELYEMSKPNFTKGQIDTYYSSLAKIKQMRLNKWDDWVNKILHLHYVIDVYKDKELVIKYEYPSNKVTTYKDGKETTSQYKAIINEKNDGFKTIIKIIMKMFSLDKSKLKNEQIDDYTVNNMITTIHSSKPVSSQLFSRFMKMARTTFIMTIFNLDDKEVFKYQEH